MKDSGLFWYVATMSLLETASCALVLSGHCFLLWIPVEGHGTCATSVPEKGACKISRGVSLRDIMDVKLIDFFVRYVNQPPKTIS